MIKVCPRCKQIYPIQDYDRDFVHTCNSGITALDQEDELKIDVVNWNFQGASNKAPGMAKAKGKNIDEVNEWGNRKSTHRTKQHYEYIEL